MPNRLGVVNYNAALNQRTLLSAQDLAEGLEDRRSRWHIDRHHRFAVPDPHRNAVSIQRAVLRRERSRTAQQPAGHTASLTYFGSTRSFGSHELKGGFESFIDTRVGANAQSSTGYVFLADIVMVGEVSQDKTPTATRSRCSCPA